VLGFGSRAVRGVAGAGGRGEEVGVELRGDLAPSLSTHTKETRCTRAACTTHSPSMCLYSHELLGRRRAALVGSPRSTPVELRASLSWKESRRSRRSVFITLERRKKLLPSLLFSRRR